MVYGGKKVIAQTPPSTSSPTMSSLPPIMVCLLPVHDNVICLVHLAHLTISQVVSEGVVRSAQLGWVTVKLLSQTQQLLWGCAELYTAQHATKTLANCCLAYINSNTLKLYIRFHWLLNGTYNKWNIHETRLPPFNCLNLSILLTS